MKLGLYSSRKNNAPRFLFAARFLGAKKVTDIITKYSLCFLYVIERIIDMYDCMYTNFSISIQKYEYFSINK